MTRSIRPLAAADVAALQRIDEVQHGQAWSRRTFADEIAGDDRVHIVAENNGQIVGHASAWVDDRSCRVTNVAVSQDHVGYGYGSALLWSLLQSVLAEHHVAYMQLEVRPSNRRAQRLYGRFGFMPVGVERDFYDRSDDRGSRDAVVMAVPDVCAEPWRDRLDQIQSELVAAADGAGAAA